MDFLEIFGQYDFLIRLTATWALVALGTYLLLHAGIFAVPQVGFMAIGAYTSAVLTTRAELPLAYSLAAALIVGALAGVVLGALLMRLDGIYLAIATIGFSEIVRVTARNLDVTGGAVGIVGVPRLLNDAALTAAVVIAVTALVAFSRSRFGRGSAAMFHDSLMARHQGVPVPGIRVLLFTATGAVCAVGGSLNVHLLGFVEPSRFGFESLISVLASGIVGGMASPFGPLLGSLVVYLVPEFLGFLGQYRNILSGAIIVAAMIWAPGGMMGLLQPVRTAARKRRVPAFDQARETAPGPDRVREDPEGSPSHQDAAPSEHELFQAERLAKHFGGVRALNGVSLRVATGEMVGLIGPNGSGKTTFLNVTSGIYRADEGRVLWEGRPLASSISPEGLVETGLARTFQNIRLVPDWTVLDNVMLGGYGATDTATGKTPRGWQGHVRDCARARLRQLDMAGTADVLASSLPYGEQRKVEIARALMSDPRLLLVDEPTAGMAPAERDMIFDLLADLRDSGIGVLVVEHDVEAIRKYCDRVVVLNFGTTIAEGPPASVFNDEGVIDAYLGRNASD